MHHIPSYSYAGLSRLTIDTWSNLVKPGTSLFNLQRRTNLLLPQLLLIKV